MQKPPFLRSLQRYIQRRINVTGRRVFLRLCHYRRRCKKRRPKNRFLSFGIESSVLFLEIVFSMLLFILYSSSTLKVLPISGLLSPEIFPFISSTSPLVILRPRPVPSILAAELSRANGSKKYALKTPQTFRRRYQRP